MRQKRAQVEHRMHHQQDRLAHGWRVAAVLLLAAVAASTAAAAEAVVVHNCSLRLVGEPGQLGQLREASLACTPAAPPLPVSVNTTFLASHTGAWQGVALRTQPCEPPVRAGGGRAPQGSPQLLALLHVCDGGHSVRLLQPAILGVHLPDPLQQGRPWHPKDPLPYVTAVLAVGGAAQVSIAGGRIARNTATSALRVWGQGQLRITGAALERNNGSNGAGVLASDNGTLFVERSSFTANTCQAGALAVKRGARARVTSSSFTDNRGTLSCAAAYAENQGSLLEVAGSNFSGNTAYVCGAVGALRGATAKVSGCWYDSNTAAEFGGAVCAFVNATVLVRGSRFSRNMAAQAGGAASAMINSSLVVSASVFEHNNATLGGSLHAEDGSRLSVAGCTLRDSIAISHGSTRPLGAANNVLDGGTGGGVFIGVSSSATVRHSQLLRCMAYFDGGAVAATATSNLSIFNTTLASNTAIGRGGGVFAAGDVTRVALRRAVFDRNTASLGGALALLHGANATVSGGTSFRNNRAYTSGGALFSDSSRTYLGCTLDLNWTLHLAADVRFANNSAETTGGDIFAGPGYELLLLQGPGNETRLNPRMPVLGLNNSTGTSVVWNRASWRACFGGEFLAVEETGFCQLCPRTQVTLAPSPPPLLRCKPCNTSEYCPGGDVIVARAGFWQHPNDTRCPGCMIDHVMRCPNPLACKHLDAESLVKNYTDAQRAPELWLNYTAALCGAAGRSAAGNAGAPVAYQGILCGECRPGWGLSSPFTCVRCLSGTAAAAGTVCLFLLNAAVSIGWVVVMAHLTWDTNAQPGGQHMEAGDVLKVLALFYQYARIIALDLHVGWWPAPMQHAIERWGRGAPGAGATSGPAAGLAALVTPVNLDCLFSALGLHLGAHQAGVKALLNLLAPLGVCLAALLCQLGWWWAAKRRCVCITCAGACMSERCFARPRRAAASFDWRLHAIITATVTLYNYYTVIARVAVASVACVSVCSVHGQQGCSWWALDAAQACPFRPATQPQLRWAIGVALPAWLCCAAAPAAALAVMWFGAHARRRGDAFEPHFRMAWGFCFSDTAVNEYLGQLAAHAAQQAQQAGSSWRQRLRARARGWSLGWAKLHLVLGWHGLTYIQMFALSSLSVAGMLLHEYHQLLLLLLLLGSYLVLVLWLRPFRSLGMQRLHGLMLTVLCTTCACLLTFIVPPGVDADSLRPTQQGLGWLVVVLNAAFVLLLLLLAVHCALRGCTWPPSKAAGMGPHALSRLLGIGGRLKTAGSSRGASGAGQS